MGSPPVAQFAPIFTSSLATHLLLYAAFYLTAAVLALRANSPLRAWKFGKLAPSYAVLRHELLYGLGSVLVLSLYDAAVLWDVATGAGYTRVDPELTLSLGFLAVWVVFAGLLAEAHFYWTHRALHASPFLYRHVHKVHHESRDPNPLSGISFHPIESAIYFSSVLCGVALLPMNVELYHAWRIALFVFPIPGHIGLGTRHWTLEWLSFNHYLHHTKTHCNYGGFVFWDRLCGTDYATWQAARDEAARTKLKADAYPVSDAYAESVRAAGSPAIRRSGRRAASPARTSKAHAA